MDEERKEEANTLALDLDYCLDRISEGTAPSAEDVPESQAHAWLAAYQWWVSATPAEVAYYVARKGTQVRIVLRNYQGHHGILQGVQWRPESIELKLTEPYNDYSEGVSFRETKTTRYPLSMIAYQEFINEREPIPVENPIVQELATHEIS